MRRTSTLLIIAASLIIICVTAAIALNQNKKVSQNTKNSPTGSPVITVIPTDNPSQKPQGNFQKTGIIVKNNPGFKKDVWYLLYDEPGSAGSKMELAFTVESVCLNNSQNISCPTNFENGQKVSIEGNKTYNTVFVQKLDVINAEVQVNGNKFIQTE